MSHEILGNSPHKVDMVSGLYEEPEQAALVDQTITQWRAAVVEAASLQNDLMGGTGATLLKTIRGLYEARLAEVAGKDPQCQALDMILASIGVKINAVPAYFEKKVRMHLGLELAIPFDSEAAPERDTGHRDT